MTPKVTKAIQAFLTPENHQKLTDWCQTNGTEISKTIRAALERYTGLDLSQPERGKYNRQSSSQSRED